MSGRIEYAAARPADIAQRFEVFKALIRKAESKDTETAAQRSYKKARIRAMLKRMETPAERESKKARIRAML
jgi:hypothetical protein